MVGASWRELPYFSQEPSYYNPSRNPTHSLSGSLDKIFELYSAYSSPSYRKGMTLEELKAKVHVEPIEEESDYCLLKNRLKKVMVLRTMDNLFKDSRGHRRSIGRKSSVSSERSDHPLMGIFRKHSQSLSVDGAQDGGAAYQGKRRVSVSKYGRLLATTSETVAT